MNKRQIFRIKIIVRLKTECFQSAGVSLYHILRVFVIAVYDPDAALTEQHSLALHIFFEACMFVRPDMVRRDIRKNSDVKCEAFAAVQF